MVTSTDEITACPQCGGPVETGTSVEVLDGQQAAHHHFSNGSKTIGPRGLPAPRRCAGACNLGWVTDPRTLRVITVRGL